MSDLCFDIEVVGPEFDQLDEPTREYLLKRARTDEDRDKVPERTALELGLGKVVAIGVHSLEKNLTAALVEFGPSGKDNFVTVQGATVEVGDEAFVLQRFWQFIAGKRHPRIVSFNGRMFDGPVIMVRSAQLGVDIARNLVPYRYDLSDHLDVAEVLNWQGSVRSNYTLDFWCRRFGIKSPKEAGISGADVARLYRDGDMQAIAEYVVRDVRRTAELYQAIAPIASVFKGGPLAKLVTDDGAPPLYQKFPKQPELALG